MKIKLIREIYFNSKKYNAGEKVDLEEAIANRWISNGFAIALSDEHSDSVKVFSATKEIDNSIKHLNNKKG